MSYFRFFLQSQYDYLNRYSRGSVIQHVDPGLFNKLEIPIPNQNPERFQQMCQLLELVNDLEEHAAKHLDCVKQLHKTLLATAFTPK